MTAPAIPADKLVAVYRKIRGVIEEKEDAHKAAIEGLKSQLDEVSSAILAICNEQGVDSLRTSQGTATRSTKTRYWTSDWEEMYRFINDHNAPYLMEQRLHAGNMKQFLEDNPDTVPVGLNTDTKYTITIRKPTNK